MVPSLLPLCSGPRSWIPKESLFNYSFPLTFATSILYVLFLARSEGLPLLYLPECREILWFSYGSAAGYGGYGGYGYFGYGGGGYGDGYGEIFGPIRRIALIIACV